MPNKIDERVIIILPSDLLEEVRRAAEDADLSVSQLVRRALRNELKVIAASKNKLSEEELRELLKKNQVQLSSLLGSGLQTTMQTAWLHGLEGFEVKPSVKLSDLANTRTDTDKNHQGAGRQENALRKSGKRGFKL